MDSRGEGSWGEGERVFIWERSIGRSGKVYEGDRRQFRENLGEMSKDTALVGTRHCRVPTRSDRSCIYKKIILS